MGRKTFSKPPAYRRHATGQATVRIAGRDHYLGEHGTRASYARYQHLVGAWIEAGCPRPWAPPEEREHEPQAAPRLMIGELVLKYLDHAEVYYRKHGEVTGEVNVCKRALSFLTERYKYADPATFGPLALRGVREAMIAELIKRPTVNAYVNRIRRVFKWAVAQEMVAPSVYEALRALDGLRRGRCAAPEPPGVRPVSEADVAKVREHLSAEVRAMVDLQLLTGMRPGEVVALRAGDIERAKDAWIYRPQGHKTEHFGRERRVLLGPKAREILEPWLVRYPTGFLFAPDRAELARHKLQRKNRKTKLWPSHKNRKRAPVPRLFRDHYSTGSYARAIAYGCQKFNENEAEAARKRGDEKEPVAIEWSPNQLRHTAATRIRREFGLEMARVVLGHSSAVTTEIYAEIDLGKAAAVMAKFG